MTAPMYEVRNVSKRFGGVLALDGFDFHLGAGEVVGLLGDNGAGKSTLIKMMSGIVQPDTGAVFVDGAPGCSPLAAGQPEDRHRDDLSGHGPGRQHVDRTKYLHGP